MATRARLLQKLFDGFDAGKEVVWPHKENEISRVMEPAFAHFSPYTFVAARSTPNFTRTTRELARCQTRVNETFVACALERYRLAQGQYPETLDALVPRYVEKLPHDIIGGQPLKYRRTNGGQFILYSIGWNETDDGGAEASTDSKPPGGALDEGDWVWRSSP